MSNPFARSVANRAVHLRIQPRPHNLAQSRAILHLISKFGVIEYWRNLKYDTLTHPHVALIIFRDESAAAKLLAKPVWKIAMSEGQNNSETAQVEEEKAEVDSEHEDAALPAEQQQQEEVEEYDDDVQDAGSEDSNQLQEDDDARKNFSLSSLKAKDTVAADLPAPPSRPLQMPYSNAPATPLVAKQPPGPRRFRLIPSEARARFRDAINMNHYFGKFELETNEPVYQDLINSVPLAGLAKTNWKAPEVPWRITQREMNKDQAGPRHLEKRMSLGKLAEMAKKQGAGELR